MFEEAFEWSISYNEHKGTHETIGEYYPKLGLDDGFLPGEWEKCLKTGKVYEGRIYPDNSAGFYLFLASTYEKVVEAMKKALESEKA